MTLTPAIQAFRYTVQVISCASIVLVVGTVVYAAGSIDFKVISLRHTKHANDLQFCTGRDPSIPGYVAIHSWNEWKEHCSQPNAEANAVNVLEIDLHLNTLLVANAGSKPSSGFSLVFRAVRETDAAISVDIVELSPGTNCPVLTEIMPTLQTYALIPQTTKPIHFVVSRALVDCSSRSTAQ